MIRILLPFVMLFVVSCSSSPVLRESILTCGDPFKGGYIGIYSLHEGKLRPPIDPQKVDLVLYYDSNDCFRGALIGNDDLTGYLYPVGYKTWEELNSLRYPEEGDEPVAAISPLGKDKEGLAFWIKTYAGEFVLAKIKTVNPSSFSDVAAGEKAEIVIEWMEKEKNLSP